MKYLRTILLYVIVVLFSPSFLNAQWTLRYPDFPAEQIHDICFLNQSTGFILNSAGSIMMTTDGGDTWKTAAYYKRNYLSEIKFINDKIGFVLSPYSYIGDVTSFLYTSDGGFHWNEGNINLGDATTFLPISASSIIKVGDYGKISKLDNFFGNWTVTFTLPRFFNEDIYVPYGDLYKFDKLPGGRILALGSSTFAKNKGIISDSVTFILKSDDSGSTWDTLWCGFPNASQTFIFLNDSVGWLGSESSRIYKTTNGGSAWTLQFVDSLHGYPIKSISTPDGLHIFSVDGSGRVIYSEDSGEHWQTNQVAQYNDVPFRISFITSKKGFLAGLDFWKTENGGATWNRFSNSLKGILVNIDFVSENTGMGIGGRSIYKTIDGGYNWTRIYESTSQSFFGLTMLDSLQVWVTGYDSVYHSTDGGISWNAFSLGDHINSISGIKFFNHTLGIIYSVHTDDGTIWNFVTTDGGDNWKKYGVAGQKYFSSFNKIKFTDPNHLWLANQKGVWLSRDTAKSWTLYSVEEAFGPFDFIDSLNGMLSMDDALFQKMAFTSNGGMSWEFINKPYPSQPADVFMYKEGGCYGRIVSLIAGNYGSLFRIGQGDNNVYDIPTYTSNTLLSFSSYRNGNYLNIWLGGTEMTLLHYKVYVSEIKELMEQNTSAYEVSQNYPNPFNSTTTIHYSLPSTQLVTIKVFDILGREIITLVNEMMFAGNYSITWDASDISSGVYYYRYTAGKFSETKKIILLR